MKIRNFDEKLKFEIILTNKDDIKLVLPCLYKDFRCTEMHGEDGELKVTIEEIIK